MKFESQFYHFYKENAFENVVCQIGSYFVHEEMS